MGRRRLSVSPAADNRSAAAVAAAANYAAGDKQLKADESSRCGFSGRVFQLLSSLWLPVFFTGINAVCYAIDPAAAALMMASSTFLLHQMGVAGRQMTMLVILAGCAALLMHGSDVVYIMVVHTLYYCAVSMKSNADAFTRIKRPYTRRGRPSGDY